jgi:putative transposase
MKQIPQKPKSVLPLFEPSCLLSSRIDPKTISLVQNHQIQYIAWSMRKASDFHRGRHVVFALNAHLVFVPKYRRKVITEQVFKILQASWMTTCNDFDCELLETNYESDHVHLLISYPPKVALSGLVNTLKGVSARMIRAANIPSVQNKLWGEHFWSPSYCAISCGGAPLERIKQYIQNQRGGTSSSP